MGWIKVRTDLARDGRLLRTAELCAQPVGLVGWAYVVLWSLADEVSTDGRLRGYSAQAIDRHVQVPGFAEAAAHKDVGWLVIGDGFVAIPRFQTHNGASAKSRAQGASRASRFRNAGITPPSRTGVTKSAPREEKRREEKRVQENPPLTPPAGGSEFAAFWAAWPSGPRKVNRVGCVKLWARLGLDAIAPEVMAGLERWKSSRQWGESGGQFIPLVATWLNQRRWEATNLEGGNGGTNRQRDSKRDREYSERIDLAFFGSGSNGVAGH